TSAAAAEVHVVSPDGAVRFNLFVEEPRLHYEVLFHGRPVIERSPLIMTIDDVEVTAAVPVGAPRIERVDEAYPPRGVHARAVDGCNDLLVSLEPAARKDLKYLLEVRAYDNGVAFRFIVLEAHHQPPRVPDEATTLTLPAGSTVWSHDLR